jgi:glutathione-independent formaldehyde dehydrogenase
LAAAASALLLGAAVVIVTDFNKERLAQARSFGCETIDLASGGTLVDQVERILGVREVDCAVDCVGFEAKGNGGAEQPAVVLNQLMDVTRAAGAIGIPGLYVTEDPGAKDDAARKGSLSLRFGLGWAKSHSFSTGQTPVLKYNRALMMAVLYDRIHIAKAVNATVIPLDQAPQGYADFDRGVARKFVIDPHGLLAQQATQ